MNNLSLVKYDENDFPFYYALVSNEMVMKQITERAIPLDEAKTITPTFWRKTLALMFLVLIKFLIPTPILDWRT